MISFVLKMRPPLATLPGRKPEKTGKHPSNTRLATGTTPKFTTTTTKLCQQQHKHHGKHGFNPAIAPNLLSAASSRLSQPKIPVTVPSRIPPVPLQTHA